MKNFNCMNGSKSNQKKSKRDIISNPHPSIISSWKIASRFSLLYSFHKESTDWKYKKGDSLVILKISVAFDFSPHFR